MFLEKLEMYLWFRRRQGTRFLFNTFNCSETDWRQICDHTLENVPRTFTQNSYGCDIGFQTWERMRWNDGFHRFSSILNSIYTYISEFWFTQIKNQESRSNLNMLSINTPFTEAWRDVAIFSIFWIAATGTPLWRHNCWRCMINLEEI